MSDTIQSKSDAMRDEAKTLLNALLKTPKGYSDKAVERFVDCVVAAALLQISAIYQPPPAGRVPMKSELPEMPGLHAMFRRMYWGQIFSLKATFAVKWIAVRSLWILRNFNDAQGGEVKP